VGSRENKTKVKKEGKGYRAFVLMEFPVGKAREELLKQLYSSENNQLYTRFRASQSFQDLKEEIDSLRKYKKEQEEGVQGFK